MSGPLTLARPGGIHRRADGARGSLHVAVVGAGVAGLVAARVAARRHAVTLFEADARPGGHTHTVVVDRGADEGLAVDTGFIVFNRRTYPQFDALLAALGVDSQPSDMSFSYTEPDSGFHYAGTGLDGLFAQRRNALRPSFLRMVAGIAAFNRRARRDLASGAARGLTLGEYLSSLPLPPSVRERYALPMGSAIWSAPAAALAGFPAEAFLRFFEQHGLLTLTDQPQWRTVRGGSHTYVRALLTAFPGEVHLGTPVRAIRRSGEGVTLHAGGTSWRFDRVIVATHADQALRLLEDPDQDERRLLGAWEYSTNQAVLHTDTRVLPPRRRAWASWNYRREPGADGRRPVSVTYWMNRLQRLEAARDYCVTLNGATPGPDDRVIAGMTYTHPRYTFASLATHAALPSLNGRRHTYFCGSYFGWGFHEDAVRSATALAPAFEVRA